jgi:hypothetical protein
MLAGHCTQRQVKEAVALADRLKDGPFDRDGFTRKLAEARNDLRSLSEHAIDEQYFGRHQDRLRRINEGHWGLGIVELVSCLTWPEFGGRKGLPPAPVNVTSETVQGRNNPDDRLGEMVRHVPLFFVSLPLVVLRMNRNPSRFFIDDGAHRAVACYLTGFREALAYIGVVREEINHKWVWLPWGT